MGSSDSRYPRFFLKALAAWQNGWREDTARRRRLVSDLTDATASASALPMAVVQCSETCYRKRFLVPNNSIRPARAAYPG